jgi:hypothetical protein
MQSLDRGSLSHSFGRRRSRLYISAQQLAHFALMQLTTSRPPFEDRVKSKPSHNGEDFNLDSSKGVANLPVMHWKRR